MTSLIRDIVILFDGLVGPIPPPDPGGTYSPSLDFSDARNSQYCSIWN
jgi:hypothetical protein